MDSDQGSEYIPSSPSDASPPSPSEAVRKRRRKPTEPLPAPPLKRAKGVFNPRYLAVLNEDIADATSGLTKEDPHSSTLPSPLLPLTHSQLGAVLWTATEKQAFFSALARLGRDDLPGIAARIGSKSALEVHQYTALLDTASRARRSDETKRRRAPRPVDIPSAAELSTELSAALEAAGDSLALRQEAHEASLEQKRWGGRWLITAELASVLEHQLQQQQRRRRGRGESNADELMPAFVELFPLRNWVRLPERVFMNASVARFADGNWRSVAEERPAVRATALADFYSLAVSVTRRLVSAALFVAGSRVRAKQAVDRRGRISAIVKTKDVQAAVASVGMKENSREFWARAARRLRLDVYGDEDEDGEEGSARTDENLEEGDEGADEETDVDTASEDDSSEEEGQALSDADSGYEDYESEPDIMSYSAVEAALGFPSTNTASRTGDSDNELREVSGFNISLDSGSDSDSDFISDEFSDGEDAGLSDRNQDDEDMPMKSSPGSPTEPPIDAEALEQDLIEALTYSALDYGDTTRSRQALQNRLKIEQRLWADAERLDERVSAAEEARLWSLLRGDETIRAKTEEKEPDLLMLESESELKLSGRRTGLADLSGNWRDHTEYYSEWEFAGGNRLGGPNG
ncbi:hypothetical protein F5Y13DRAFT_203539 [Hypoxylon sp. FL1857]|nr:hypothetical protein F5Y13DRAFT_203539 [Hypoxylon sp. FL1857]